MNAIEFPSKVEEKTQVMIDCAGATDKGQVRENNQDQFLIADLHKKLHVRSASCVPSNTDVSGSSMGRILVVADGMGGANAGEVASELAIQSIARFLLNSMHWLFHPQQPEVERFIEDLKNAVQFSHQQVWEDANRDPNHFGMGTTLTAAYLIWPMLYVLHIGDSRCYLLHNGQLELLTKDQTFAQYLYDQGQISEETLESSPYNHVLLNAIGIDGEPDSLVYRRRLCKDDRILLCSDGVNLHLTDEEICETVERASDAQAICDELVDRANKNGGRDNVTAVAAIFNGM